MQITLYPEQLELLPLMPRVSSFKADKAAPPAIRRCTPAMLRRYPYIKINPPRLAMWLGFDIDRPGALLAWETANLPPPAAGVADPVSTRGHLLYPLAAPVLTGDGARDAPLRYLAAVEAGMRAKLGADPQFSASTHHSKNPFWRNWRVVYGPARTWELGELAEWVDLPRHLPRRGLRVANLGYGRNCTLFDRLRFWAYRAVRRFWTESCNYILWEQACYRQALLFNGDFAQVGGEWHSLSGPLGKQEVFHVAKHVSLWVWRRFTPDQYAKAFSKFQSLRRYKKYEEIMQWARECQRSGT